MLIKNSKAWAQTTYRAYLAAILGVGIAFLIRYELHPILQSTFPVLFFIINTTFIGYKFGWGPATFSVILSIPLGYYFFIPPYGRFELSDPMDFLNILIYAFFFFITIFFIERLQRERYRAVLIARVCESRMLIMAKLSSASRRDRNKDIQL